MAKDLETYRSEICDLYLVQDRSLKQVISLMQDKHDLRASERTYWKKLKAWGALKHISKRQAQRTPRPSVDSGYRSQSLRSCDSTVSQYSQPVDDYHFGPRPFTPSDEQLPQYGLPCLTGHSSPCYSISESSLAGCWSPGSSQAENLSIDTVFSLVIPEQPREHHHFRDASLSSNEASSRQRSHLTDVPLSFSKRCMGFSHLSSLAFCAPHALPSRCLAAHTEMNLFGPSHDTLSCQHCNATKLHHLASLAQEIDILDFKRVLYAYKYLLGEYDNRGNSCVHFAAGSGASLAHLALLAGEGAPMELVNDDSQTFLHVLNTKLYSPETLAPIIEWALFTKGAMTKRDSHQRTVWHTLLQRGLKLDTFRSILPYLERNKDDMMILDCENHTPLDCLRSCWTSAGEDGAIDYLNMLQATHKLPLGYAVNRTLPLDNILDQAKTYSEPHTSSVGPAMPRLTDEIRNISIRTSSKGYGLKTLPKGGVGEVLSSYVNGRPLDFTAGLVSTGPSLEHGRPRAFSPLPTNTPKKARRLLGP